jgi:hypothetical protein
MLLVLILCVIASLRGGGNHAFPIPEYRGVTGLAAPSVRKTSNLTIADIKLDQYGGLSNTPSPGGATGFFRVEKTASGHWRLVTPSGNYTWMNAVYYINDRLDGGTNYSNVASTKYSSSLQWAAQAINRIKSWGFNTIGPGFAAGSHNVLPITSYGNPANPTRAPFYSSVNFSYYCLGSSTYKVKNLYANTNPTVYSVARDFPDVFDPAFANCANVLAPGDGSIPNNTPWLIGMSIGDKDYLFGLIKGPNDPDHPHLGWISAITSPTQTNGPNGDIGNRFSYSDTIVHAKSQWQAFVMARYSSISAMNAAWGSTYTTFASSGGWPKGRTNGTGLMDEDGTSSWVPNCSGNCTGGSAKMQTDLNSFLATIADQFYSKTAAAIRAAYPHTLVFSEEAEVPETYPFVLQKAGLYLDVIEMSFDTLSTGANYVGILPTAYSYLQKPILTYTSIMAPKDSEATQAPYGRVYATCDITNGLTGLQYTTQALRGECYGQLVNRYVTSKGTDGSYPVIGISWWEFIDKVVGGENTNFGLVSQYDNAYDGFEDQVAVAADSWGFTTGNEPHNHGNFLDSVKQANLNILRAIVTAP